MLSIQVGAWLFRVPRDAFVNQSEFFRNELAKREKTAPAGDIVDTVILEDVEEDQDDGTEEDLPLPKKPPARKTKQQRKKAEKLRAEVRIICFVPVSLGCMD